MGDAPSFARAESTGLAGALRLLTAAVQVPVPVGEATRSTSGAAAGDCGSSPGEIARAVAAALEGPLAEVRREQMAAVERLEEPLRQLQSELAVLRSDVQAIKGQCAA